MAAPPSQKFRTISFTLSGVPGAADKYFVFSLRPEDVTASEVSRLTVQQTLGGAWADSFDKGITSINLSGHHGWHGGILLSGEDLFRAMRATCWQGWHDGRKAAIQAGQDPNTVQLFYTDNLDDITAIVAPSHFTLRRSRSSPLLMRYQVQLLVLGDASDAVGIADQIINALSNPLRWLASVTGLDAILPVIESNLDLGLAVFGAGAQGIQQFVNVGVQLIGSVADIARQTQGVFSDQDNGILTIGTQFSRAASTAFSVLAMDDTLSDEERLPIMALSSSFNDAACSMANGFSLLNGYDDLSSLRGASTCSSTGGGDPASDFTLSGANPFEFMFPVTNPPVAVSAEAQQALTALQSDPLQMQGQVSIVADLMRRAGQGTAVASTQPEIAYYGDLFPSSTSASSSPIAPAGTTGTPTPPPMAGTPAPTPIPTPVQPVPLPPPTVASVMVGTGPDTLIIRISGDALRNNDGSSDIAGNPLFNVSIDNVQLGENYIATAVHKTGGYGEFIFNGYFGTGAHTLRVTFLNDAFQDGFNDRNLYVDGINYLGSDLGKSFAMLSGGAQAITITGGTQQPQSGGGGDTSITSVTGFPLRWFNRAAASYSGGGPSPVTISAPSSRVSGFPTNTPSALITPMSGNGIYTHKVREFYPAVQFYAFGPAFIPAGGARLLTVSVFNPSSLGSTISINYWNSLVDPGTALLTGFFAEAAEGQPFVIRTKIDGTTYTWGISADGTAGTFNIIGSATVADVGLFESVGLHVNPLDLDGFMMPLIATWNGLAYSPSLDMQVAA